MASTHTDGDIDVDALQAQIDLSVSYMNNLVTSWITPSTMASFPRREVSDRELKEIMRRPARLGVGAAIPEFAGRPTELAQLKGRLSEKREKKRVFPDAEDDSTKQGPEGDEDNEEEESRAGAIRHKPRVDVLGGPSKKKKRKNSAMANVFPTSYETLALSRIAASTEHNPRGTGSQQVEGTGADDQVEVFASSVQPASPPKAKNKRKKHPEVVPTPTGSVDAVEPSRGSPTAPIPGSAWAQKEQPPDRHEGTSSSPKRTSPVTKASIPPLGVKASVPISLLDEPILNLHGPPPPVSSVAGTQPAGASPKKKRKRRKKNKRSTGDPSQERGPR